MLAVQTEPLFVRLNRRRKDLGMTYAALAHRSGVSMTSVVRILSGQHPQANFASVNAVAEALGMNFDAAPRVQANAFRERRARQKAERLIKMVQGTSALEAQAVEAEQLEEMTWQTVHELLAGSPRRLWDD